MTKPKKHMYRIQYIDNTYQIVDWTKPEFEKIGTAMEEGKLAILLDDGIFRLGDVRAVVYMPPVPELTPEEKKAKEEDEQGLSEWGFVDPDVQEWLKNQGINISKREVN